MGVVVGAVDFHFIFLHSVYSWSFMANVSSSNTVSFLFVLNVIREIENYLLMVIIRFQRNGL